MATLDPEDPPLEGTAPRVSHSVRRHVEGPQLARYHDHFTLNTKSTVVRFRSKTNAARVYDNHGSQLVLEESVDPVTKTSQVSVKHLVDGTSGLKGLRACYTVVTALFCGFMFVFYLNLLLFMVLDLAIASGQASASKTQAFSGPLSAGIILAMITFTDGFAKALVIAGHFVYDTWSGHLLVKRFFLTSLSDVIVDWIFFVFFICVPVLVAAYMLFNQADDWWYITALSWFSSIQVFYTAFAWNIVWVEVSSAYNFVKNRADTDKTSFLQVIKRCILLRQVQEYSGKRRATYLSRSTFTSTEDTEVSRKADVFENTRRETIGPYSRLTADPRLAQFFIVKDPPVNLFSIEDVADYRPFLTRHTWSLERVFCRPRDSRYITVVKGPGSLRRAQLRSSVLCSFIGTGLILLIFIAFLWWLGIGGAYITFIFVIAAYLAAQALDNAFRLAMVAQDLIDVNLQLPDVNKQLAKLHLRVLTGQPGIQDDPAPEQKEEEEEEEEAMTEEEQELHANASQAIYLVTQYQRTREATEKLCWIMFGVELVVYYIYPWLCLYVLGNYAVGSLFLIVGTVSGIRHYINAAVAVEETGNMSLIDGKTENISWQNKSRFNEIIETVTVSKTKFVWKRLLQVGGFGYFALFLGAIGEDSSGTVSVDSVYLPDFYYPELKNDMRYPTCTLGNIQGGFGPTSTMADFAFLAGVAYKRNEAVQPTLDKWFLNTTDVIHDVQSVLEFRERIGEADSSVHFKFVKFPQYKLNMILIRGTQTKWDMLADSQLWTAASLMQVVRSLLPFGEIWTPILDQLVLTINGFESESADRISFYKVTTKFAKELKANSTELGYAVQVTGHSLGGGLSMITGAQAGIPAIGLSGPNALISGRSFTPPVTPEQLNRYAFNIIPNRDIVPMLDDHADQFQLIRCGAKLNDFIGCHDSTRSLCEILTTCGSGLRPPPCDCYTRFGFAPPVAKGNRTFGEACGVPEPMPNQTYLWGYTV